VAARKIGAVALENRIARRLKSRAVWQLRQRIQKR